MKTKTRRNIAIVLTLIFLVMIFAVSWWGVIPMIIFGVFAYKFEQQYLAEKSKGEEFQEVEVQ